MSYSASGMTKAGVASASWTSTALAGSLPQMGVSFATAPLGEDVEVTGPVVLVLWVASGTEDMDIFATLRNIAPTARMCSRWKRRVNRFRWPRVGFARPIAGWTRTLSLPFRPYHAHANAKWLIRAIRCAWRSRSGRRHGVQARPSHPARCPAPRRRRQRAVHALRSRLQFGTNTIFAGGARASYLLLPIIPRRA